MALTVNFWIFSKKENSTAVPAGTPIQSFSCELKSDSGVLSPVLEIGLPMSTNPALWNYAQIPAYNRYYYVSDWQWSEGLWLCSLEVDALASYRVQIGNASKYILRAAADYDPDIIDNFYPAKEHVNVSWSSYSFPWYNNFTNGSFILGVINGSGGALAGTTEYYILSSQEIKNFMSYLFPPSSVSWTSLNAMEESIYKSIYDPLQFIVSCKYFPFSVGGLESPAEIQFGNFTATAQWAEPLSKPNLWPIFSHDYSLPSGWLSRDARDRCEPFCDIFFWLNPFGVIRLSTSDFTLTDTVRVRITPDMISGEATIQIFSLVGASEVLVAQQTAMLGFDVNLTAINRDTPSAIAALIGGAALAGSEMASGLPPISILTSAGDAYASLAKPSISHSSRGTPSICMLDGSSRLYSRRHTFADSHVSEFGRPLYQTRTISTLSGYIKCGDGDISLPAYPEEARAVSEAMTGGFYYE